MVFTKNISEGINLVAYALGNATAGQSGGSGRFRLGPGDEIVITEMEHHSNIVPWQLLCERTGATLRWFGVTDDGQLDLSQAGELINERTRLVALAHQSNVLGTINPVREIADAAHAAGALVLVDAAQSVPHMPVDVQELGADFLGFTSHKMCGPTGIGVLWGRRELLEEMPPFLGGGEMIESVWMDHSTFAPPPHKFEAGTMPIAEAAGLDAAIDYLTDVGLDAVRAHEQDLIAYALEALGGVPGLRVLGPSDPADARRGDLVHPGGRAPARREPGARRARRGRPGRAPLRLAAAPPVWHPGQHPGLVLPVQHDRGGGRPGPGDRAGAAVLRGGLMRLESLYQEVILDHYRHPHHKGLREPYDAEVHHVNPLCGDEVTLRVTLKDATGEPVVADVSYDALGCSISQASASVMSELIIGRTVPEAMSLAEEFLRLMQSKGQPEPDEEILGDGVAFAGVAKYPARIKCALLGWMAWKDATAQALEEQK